MLKDQCISVTELRTNTKQCLSGLSKEPKYIFINNQPVAVLLDIDQYEEIAFRPILMELSEDEVDAELKLAAAKARKSKKEDLVNL